MAFEISRCRATLRKIGASGEIQQGPGGITGHQRRFAADIPGDGCRFLREKHVLATAVDNQLVAQAHRCDGGDGLDR